MSGEAVKAELLIALRALGVRAVPEVSLPAKSPRSRGVRPTFRVDVAVLADAAPTRVVAVAECKPYRGDLKGTRQRENYERCGVPYWTCGPGEERKVAAALAVVARGR